MKFKSSTKDIYSILIKNLLHFEYLYSVEQQPFGSHLSLHVANWDNQCSNN